MMQILKYNYLCHEFYRIQNEGSKLLWINMSEEEKKMIKCLTGHISYGLHEYVPWECKYVTFLRHPFERIISWYYYIKTKNNHQLAKMCTDMTLAEIVESRSVSETNNGMTRYLAGRKDIGIHPPFDITAENDLSLAKIHQRVFSSRNVDGLGMGNSWGDNIYTVVELWKEEGDAIEKYGPRLQVI